MMMCPGEMERYERLICRVLDGEASPQQRAELEAAMRGDPRVQKLFESTAALDAQVGRALREALAPAAARVPQEPGRPAGSARDDRFWRRVGRLAGLAAAACIAWLLATGPQKARVAEEVAAASWFAPPPESADALEEPGSFASIPGLRVRDARSGWLVVPTRDPREYLVIEVARIRETMVPIELDY